MHRNAGFFPDQVENSHAESLHLLVCIYVCFQMLVSPVLNGGVNTSPATCDLRPALYFEMDSEQQRRTALLMSQIVSDKHKRLPALVAPEIVSDTEHCGWDITHRSGRPHERSFQEDECSLFFDHLYSTEYASPKRYLTSFAIKRGIFHAFFGFGPFELRGNVNTAPP